MLQRVSFWWTVHIDKRGGGLHRLCRTSLTLALSLAACTGSGVSSSAPAPSAAPSASAVRPVSTASANSEYYYPVTLEVYNNARELVPYTFEQCPERTLVYGKNNVEIMLALGLEDKILMTADCSSVLPEYEEAFAELDRVKNHQDVGYFVKEYALSLEPDMVIGWYSLFNIEDRMGDVGFWHERGIGTYTSINSVLKDDQSLQNEYADIRNIAAIYNKQEKAEEIIAEIEAAAGSEPQRILIAEKYEGEYDIYHAKSCAGDIAAQLGAEPLGEKGWTDEQIVEANPEAIFSVHVSSVTDEEAVNLFLDNPALASVDAVKNGLPAYACALLLLAAGLVLSVLYAVTVGSAELSVGEVYRVILYELFRWGDPEQLGSGAVHDIVWLIRLPRVVLAVLVGMGLSVVGAVMQAIVKNPLADPYVLGISSGASLGATLTLLLGAGLFGAAGVGLGAFIGALVAAFSVIAIAGIGGRITSVKLILAGVALSSLCSAFSNLIVYVADDPSRFMTVQFWLMGSLAGAQWSGNFRILCVVLPCTLFFISQARILNLMLMGDDTAVTLGTDLQPYRRVYLVIASLMVGFVVHVSGVIGFVGLIIPHTVRGIFGVDHKKLLPLSALTGSVFLVWADVAARTILPRTEVPIGILISVVGAPFFIFLMVRKNYSFGGRA